MVLGLIKVRVGLGNVDHRESDIIPQFGSEIHAGSEAKINNNHQ